MQKAFPAIPVRITLNYATKILKDSTHDPLGMSKIFIRLPERIKISQLFFVAEITPSRFAAEHVPLTAWKTIESVNGF